MSTSARNELLWRFAETEDPEVEEREKQILEVLLDVTTQKFVKKGRLTEARAALHRVLARRQLAVSHEDAARIEACSDLATLERWLDQAVTAPTAADALR